MSLGETLKAIHYTFMCAYNQLKIIVIAELHDPIRLQHQTFLDDIRHKWIFKIPIKVTNFYIPDTLEHKNSWNINLSKVEKLRGRHRR